MSAALYAAVQNETVLNRKGIRMGKLTMADIARQAGVGKSTVSRYFNNGYVSDEARTKISKVVQKTGFEPSVAAQNLRLKETHTIGIIAPTMTSVVTGRRLTAMDETLREAGYSCIIITTNHHPEREIAAIEYLRSLRLDGVILIATTIGKELEALQKSSEVPFLVVGQEFESGTSIVYDDYRAGKEVGQYARRMGHEDIVYLGVTEKDEAVGRLRKQGVFDGLKQDGETVKIADMRETSFSYEDARVLTEQILDEHVPTLIICATDKIALGACKAIQERGLRVPEDVSLIGFGGYEAGSLLTPSLTSVHFQNHEAGVMAARTLISMIHGDPVGRMQLVGYTFDKGGSVLDRRAQAEDRADSDGEKTQED